MLFSNNKNKHYVDNDIRVIWFLHFTYIYNNVKILTKLQNAILKQRIY